MCDTVERLLASLLDLFKCLYCVWFMVSAVEEGVRDGGWLRAEGSGLVPKNLVFAKKNFVVHCIC